MFIYRVLVVFYSVNIICMCVNILLYKNIVEFLFLIV